MLTAQVAHGRILSVRDEVLGDHLSAAVIATNTTIYLDDLSYFEETGGQALLVEDAIDNELITYTGFDAAETGLVLSAGLVANHDAGTVVQVYPLKSNRIAYVQVDDPEREPIPVRVPFGLKDRVPLGLRSDVVGQDEVTANAPEEALIHLEHREWALVDVPRQGLRIDVSSIDVVSGYRNVVETKTDFLGPPTNVQSGDFIGFSVGAGAQIISEFVPDTGHRGIWELQTGTDANGSSRVSTQTGTTIVGSGRIRVGCMLRPPGNLSDGTDRYTIYFGLTNAGAESAVTQGVYIRYRDNLNGGAWQGSAIHGASSLTDPMDDNGGAVVALGDGWVLLEVEVNAAGDQVDLYVNGALKGSLSGASLPTNVDALEPRVGIEKSAGGGNRGMDADYIYYLEELSEPR